MIQNRNKLNVIKLQKENKILRLWEHCGTLWTTPCTLLLRDRLNKVLMLCFTSHNLDLVVLPATSVAYLPQGGNSVCFSTGTIFWVENFQISFFGSGLNNVIFWVQNI